MATRRGRRGAASAAAPTTTKAKQYLVVQWRRKGRFNYRGAIFEPGIIGAPGHPERLNPNAVRAVAKDVRDHLVGTGFFRDVTQGQMEEANEFLLYARGGMAAAKATTVARNTRRRRASQAGPGHEAVAGEGGGTPL